MSLQSALRHVAARSNNVEIRRAFEALARELDQQEDAAQELDDSLMDEIGLDKMWGDS